MMLNHSAVESFRDNILVSPESLGNAQFRQDYGLKYNYLCGSMYKGISSVEMVVALGKAGFMGYLGTGGLRLELIESSIFDIKRQLSSTQSFGMNLLNNPDNPFLEMEIVDLYIKHNIRFIEASAYIQISPALVRYRLHGMYEDAQGIHAPNKVLAKVSRPEVADVFMRPAPEKILQYLLEAGFISEEEAKLGRRIPIAQDICVEADSGGHTDQGNAYVLTPAISFLRNQIMAEEKYSAPIRVGAAGGIGTPESIVAALMLGADFIMTGSINQCTVEAGTSDAVKDLLQAINVQDTDYAPAGDMFEIGARVQVVKKGVFFPARANKLYELYLRHNSIEELDERSKKQIQEKYFKRSFESVWDETKKYYLASNPKKLEEIQKNPKQKMALIFRWYFIHTSRLALSGSDEQRVDYQIHCGPALGAFNQWIKGTKLENWRERRVSEIGELIFTKAAELMESRLRSVCKQSNL
jgi:trans-AT polyketide synthase/acyltransferase/oxidoreductase domain-containing protein